MSWQCVTLTIKSRKHSFTHCFYLVVNINEISDSFMISKFLAWSLTFKDKSNMIFTSQTSLVSLLPTWKALPWYPCMYFMDKRDMPIGNIAGCGIAFVRTRHSLNYLHCCHCGTMTKRAYRRKCALGLTVPERWISHAGEAWHQTAIMVARTECWALTSLVQA